ncbi:MAG: cytochrome c biogenesis protein CcsA [Deltaproteobacteria bacterium]|nr:cytochrome c biogenesis protein CcsA [Deltaproteobacteria bacterium]
MTSTLFFNLCGAGYFLGLFLYLANLAIKKASLRRTATLLVAVSFLTQIAGLVVRWHEAGLVELQAAERATGLTLEGAQRFVVYTRHPPWSNLYEMMVYMAWGVVFVFLVSEVKFRIRFAGIFALALALVSLGLASLTTDAAIKPLVPALQSWWIMIHVVSSAVGYAAGTLGAVLSLLFLVKAKERVSLSSVAAGTLVVSMALFLLLGRGAHLFTTGAYRVKLMSDMGGDLNPAGRFVGNNFHPYYVPSPGVGLVMIATLVIAAVAVALLLRARKDDVPQGLARYAYFAAFGATTATIGLILLNAFTQMDVQVPPEVAAEMVVPGPWRLAVESAQWDLALFGIAWGGQLFLLLALLFPDKLRSLMADSARLDRAAYYSILVAFALVAVVLVTGALWAHYAWGRYWGWDPKETGALVIWITYAIYLHARVTYGWVGVPSAIIGVVGFFIIIAGFLGVNLGYFADGLHSYGAG